MGIIPEGGQGNTQFFNCQVLNLDNLFSGTERLQKVCSNKRTNAATNAAPLGIVPLLFVFGSN
jgi:hypothetical protein